LTFFNNIYNVTIKDGINIFEEDFWAINDTLNRLLQGTNARIILLIDKAGQLISSCGDTAKGGEDTMNICDVNRYFTSMTLRNVIWLEVFTSIKYTP